MEPCQGAHFSRFWGIVERGCGSGASKPLSIADGRYYVKDSCLRRSDVRQRAKSLKNMGWPPRNTRNTRNTRYTRYTR